MLQHQLRCHPLRRWTLATVALVLVLAGVLLQTPSSWSLLSTRIKPPRALPSAHLSSNARHIPRLVYKAQGAQAAAVAPPRSRSGALPLAVPSAKLLRSVWSALLWPLVSGLITASVLVVRHQSSTRLSQCRAASPWAATMCMGATAGEPAEVNRAQHTRLTRPIVARGQARVSDNCRSCGTATTLRSLRRRLFLSLVAASACQALPVRSAEPPPTNIPRKPQPPTPPAPGGTAPAPSASGRRRPALRGFAEVIVDANDGYEMLTPSARVLDAVPPLLRPVLRKVRVRSRRLQDTELFTAGFVGGIVAEVAKVIVLHPLDTIKARIQARRTRAEPETEALYTSSIFDRPYAGLGPAVVSAAPQAGIFFATRDVMRREVFGLVAESRVDSTTAALAAVAAATCAYWVIRAPSEVFKLRSQAATPAPHARGTSAEVNAESLHAESGQPCEAHSEAAAQATTPPSPQLSVNYVDVESAPQDTQSAQSLEAHHANLPTASNVASVARLAPATDEYSVVDYVRLGAAAYPACLAADLPAICCRALTYQVLLARCCCRCVSGCLLARANDEPRQPLTCRNPPMLHESKTSSLD